MSPATAMNTGDLPLSEWIFLCYVREKAIVGRGEDSPCEKALNNQVDLGEVSL